ncbi:MAG: hypothetical protein HZB38_04740 [Planctomycetes bacterium]|nr:hypothetical protein [Planctomycetota bacterium]
MLLLAFGSSGRAADVPPRSEAGQTLVPTAAQLDMGDIYHIYTGEDAQLIATSDAQLQRVAVTCRRVVGYFVVPFDRGPDDPPIAAGFGRIPAASLETGNAGLNALVRQLFGGGESHEITFAITGSSNLAKTSKAGEPETFTMVLSAEVSAGGKSTAISAPATVSLLPFTFRTMARYPGDILTLRAAFDLKLADLAGEKPGREWADKLAESVHVDVFLLANTVSPEKSLDPAIKQPHNIKHLRFLTQVRDFDDPVAGYAWGRTFMHEVWNDSGPLARLALDTVAEDGIRSRDFAFALEAAGRANEVAKGESAQVLDTLARVHYEKGDFDEAIRVQRQAVEKSKSLPPAASQPFADTLSKYEKRKPAK